jgi:hypothetical protein
VGVNVATAATVEDYALPRDQLGFGLQKWLKDDRAIPQDPKLQAELVAPMGCIGETAVLRAPRRARGRFLP